MVCKQGKNSEVTFCFIVKLPQHFLFILLTLYNHWLFNVFITLLYEQYIHVHPWKFKVLKFRQNVWCSLFRGMVLRSKESCNITAQNSCVHRSTNPITYNYCFLTLERDKSIKDGVLTCNYCLNEKTRRNLGSAAFPGKNVRKRYPVSKLVVWLWFQPIAQRVTKCATQPTKWLK